MVMQHVLRKLAVSTCGGPSLLIGLSLSLSLLVSSCTVDGVTHANGTSFTAPDGCNTW